MFNLQNQRSTSISFIFITDAEYRKIRRIQDYNLQRGGTWPKPKMSKFIDKATSSPIENNWGSRSHVQSLVLISATVFGLYLCYLLAEPFLPAISWALALTVLFTPLQKTLESILKHPNSATLVTVLIIGLIVVVPAVFVGQRLVTQSVKGAELIESKVSSGEWRRVIEARPRLVPLADKIEQAIDLSGAARTLATWLSTVAGTVVSGSVFQLINAGLIFYLLFFFLRDRHAALTGIRSLSPLSNADTNLLFSRVSDTIHATLYGTLTVSSVQGLLGGLMFWWLDLPAALLWGVVMAILAVVPVLGAFIVWMPAALFLALEGDWGKALILALWGLMVVGTIDNLLRPVLVGRRLKLHTVLAFVSVVGGLLVFGPAGLILGPVALTTTSVLLECWRNRYVVENDGANSPVSSK